MNTLRAPLSLSLVLVAASFVAGCGGGASDQPDIGTVTGVVKLDGQPLPDAEVKFQPDEGRPSSAITDAQGNYELVYTRDVEGAKIGKHKVSITTASTGTEKVPDVYNAKTELTAEVKSGSQTINFDQLDSKKGTIVQPVVEDDGC